LPERSRVELSAYIVRTAILDREGPNNVTVDTQATNGHNNVVLGHFYELKGVMGDDKKAPFHGVLE